MLEEIKNTCDKHGVKLIYLVKFGSHLYGTNTPASDTDYKGLFLPSKEQLFLQNVSKHITYSTGDGGGKNTAEDIDVQLWSLQYFLSLVSKGETNALDLLYSFTYPEIVEYIDTPMGDIHNLHNKLFDIRHCKAFVGYAISQAKKYGIKGSRLGVLKKVYELIPELLKGLPSKLQMDITEIRLSSILNEIVERCYDTSYCFTKMIGAKGHEPVNSLILCGKVHQGSIKLIEFIQRVNTEYERYGKRAEEAEKNNGIDWKALSHAVRALGQMRQLIDNGIIQYPLYNAKEILDIKLGKSTFKEVEKIIYEGIAEIDAKLNDPNLEIFNKKDKNVINGIILGAYNEKI